MSRSASPMPHLRFVVALCAATLLAVAVLAPAAKAADGLTAGALYQAGPDGRYLMGRRLALPARRRRPGPQAALHAHDGQRRLDDDEGPRTRGTRPTPPTSRWPARSAGTARTSTSPSSNGGARLGRCASSRSTTARSFWMNGKPIGSNTGAYLPVRDPDPVVHAEAQRASTGSSSGSTAAGYPTDFPPSGLTPTNLPTGGWWNYGGILREVYLRKVDRIDFNTVVVRPELPCARCNASVLLRTTVRNASSSTPAGPRHRQLRRARRATSAARPSAPTTSRRSPSACTVDASAAVGAGLADPLHATFTARVGEHEGRAAGAAERHPQDPGAPRQAYPQRPAAERARRRPARGRPERSASRSTTPAARSTSPRSRSSGATIIRAHYPLHPYLEELADQRGHPPLVGGPGLRGQDAVPQARDRAQARGEGAGRRTSTPTRTTRRCIALVARQRALRRGPGPSRATTSARAAEQAKELDPTRPVGLAVAGYPSVGLPGRSTRRWTCVGINDYFGWYPGPERRDLRPRRALGLPRLASAPATRTRRS